ncbi:MAG TPA: GAF domain-containing protein [Vicinamibacterales bacterium]|nr:GAF domain-containing protein [Vicinamibacterales bacterium]
MHRQASAREHGFENEQRLRQQTAIADLARLAIGAESVDALLPRALELCRSELGLDVDPAVLLNRDGAAAHVFPRALDDGEQAFLSAVANVVQLLADRRAIERRTLAEVEGRFGRIFQLSPVALGMSTIDDGRIVDVNEQWLSLFGYRRDEVIGRTNAELNINAEATPRHEIARQAVLDRQIRGREMQVRTKSGEIIDIIASAVPLDTGAESSVWISACVEITGRNRAEAERNRLLSREQAARAEAEQALEQLRAVYAITDSAAAGGPSGELLGEVLRRLRQTLQVDHATVLLLDDEGKSLHLRALVGPDGEQQPVPDVRVPIGAGVSGRVAAEGRPIIVNDYVPLETPTIQPAAMHRLRQIASVMGAPFRFSERVAGVVMVSTTEPRQFAEEDLRLLVLAADRVGVSIERGRFIERIRTGIARQRALSRRLLHAQEEERRRLAVELHDELGQVLTAVKINLESLARAKGPAPTFATMTQTIQSVDEALLRVRDMALDLRPSVLDDLGLAAAIRWYADRFARGAPIETNLSIDALPPLEPGLQTACFRVTQEALTNVERHARARRVWIDLHVLDGALELSIRDDGIGFDVAAARARAISGGSVGLLGMQERVSLLGGEYDVVQMAGGGTEIRARFPLMAGGAV